MPSKPVLGQQSDANRQGIASGHQPIAIVLDLVHPVRPGWRRSQGDRWEAQFKLAKCCMRASTSISDLRVFLAEPVLERSKALNDIAARLRENAPN
jgi:hypothetical protein